jgi:hypothetical protein
VYNVQQNKNHSTKDTKQIFYFFAGMSIFSNGLNRGGFHKAIYAIGLKFALCAHHFSLILYHVFAPYTQLIAFSPIIG